MHVARHLTGFSEASVCTRETQHHVKNRQISSQRSSDPELGGEAVANHISEFAASTTYVTAATYYRARWAGLAARWRVKLTR